MRDALGAPRHTSTVAVLFCDLVDSTARQSRLGDDAADSFRRAFYAALRDAVAAAGGQEVKNTGDGLMVVFPTSAGQAVACAVAMHETTEALDADDPALLRVGISAGEVAEDDGDWFGTPVVEAARLCALAGPGRTLVSDVVRSLVGSRGGHEFRSRGKLMLKGITNPVAASELLREPTPAPKRAVKHGRRRVPALLVAAGALVAIAFVVGLLLARRDDTDTSDRAGGVPPAVGYTPRFTSRTCPAEVTAAMQRASCGTLTVPEDRSHPDNGHTVKLLVTRAPAREDETEDPVVDFGADALATSPVRVHAEEIQILPRGFGLSEPELTCPEYAAIAPNSFTRPPRDAESIREGSAALTACRDRLEQQGIDVDAYNLEASGEDVLDLLRALRLRRVHLVAGYVVTISALRVAREARDTIASMTLQGPVVPGDSSSTDPTAYLSEAFDRYVELCAIDAKCAALGDLRRLLTEYSAALTPTTAMGDDGEGHVHAVYIDRDRLAQAIAGVLFDLGAVPLLAAGIAQANSPVINDLVAGQVIRYNRAMVDARFPWGALLASRCSYDMNTVAPGHVLSSESLPAFRGVDDGTLAWQCAAWDAKPLSDAAFDDSLTVDVPTLIVQGGLAPLVSQEWSELLRQHTLSHATVVTFATLSAAPLVEGPPPCLGELRRRFISQPEERVDVAACEAETPKINFVSPVP
jgi:class 3 adenylate cyclase/pimeloyl-ACP methyl ester carboxylesterase